ncbi:alpha/beta-hydrolase [Aspergillus ambiguus]|uniref:alpha/beta-hydrolase n=1 Tax=Aspergillus ambiguus TaxID=176160 RepID=UPI003CCE4969
MNIMASTRSLTVAEWVGVGVAISKTILSTTVSALIGLFHGSNRPASYHRHVTFSFVRAFTSNLSPKALVALSPSTDDGYRKFCTCIGLTPDTVTLEDGTRGHWIGDRSADKVVLYFHGGGYAMCAVDGHFELLWNVVQDARRTGKSVSVLFLAYDVAVDAPYPRQLQQAAALLDYLHHTLNRPLSEILLVGDSAGGNLVLALLSHILHPHPKVARLSATGQFAGAALLSPWVTFNTTDSKSMKVNKNLDTLAIPVLNSWSKLFQGDAPTDYYLEPLSAPLQWWNDLPVKDVLVSAGGEEIFVDDIDSMTTRLRSGNVKTTLVIGRGEAHDHAVMEFGLKEPQSQQRAAFQEWICARLQD